MHGTYIKIVQLSLNSKLSDDDWLPQLTQSNTTQHNTTLHCDKSNGLLNSLHPKLPSKP